MQQRSERSGSDGLGRWLRRWLRPLLGVVLALGLWVGLTGAPAPAFAYDNPDLLPDHPTPVIDLAKILTDPQRAALEAELEDFEHVSGWKLRVPPNITVICLGKSTYARLGIIVNTTPAEASWEGHLTLEFSNSSGADCRIYANEGICQLLFFEGDPCETTYQDRAGKYQHQPERVTLAKV